MALGTSFVEDCFSMDISGGGLGEMLGAGCMVSVGSDRNVSNGGVIHAVT